MVLERFRLDDQVAIVTGAGRGLGAATALALAEAGCDVVISARTPDQLAGVAAQIEGLGRRALVVTADLSDLDAVAGLASAAEKEFGRIDVVVNNVGGTMPRRSWTPRRRTWKAPSHFNVTTAHVLTRAAVPVMLANGGGSVVSMSSVMGRLAGRGFVAYGTAKAGLSHWTRLAARDLSPRIRVNAICVGSIATSALEIVTSDEGLRTSMEQATPLRRIGDPDDIAATVLWLASAAGSYVTGKVIEVDGGLDTPNLDLGMEDLYDDRLTRPAPCGRLEHRQRRTPRPRRHRRPSRTWSWSGSGSPARPRSARTPGSSRAWDATSACSPRNDADALIALQPDCILHSAIADDRLVEALEDIEKMLAAGINVVSSGPGLPAVPLRRRRGECAEPASPLRPRRAGSRSGSTGSTPASPTTGSRWPSPASASASRKSAAWRCSTTPPTTTP